MAASAKDICVLFRLENGGEVVIGSADHIQHQRMCLSLTRIEAALSEWMNAPIAVTILWPSLSSQLRGGPPAQKDFKKTSAMILGYSRNHQDMINLKARYLTVARKSTPTASSQPPTKRSRPSTTAIPSSSQISQLLDESNVDGDEDEKESETDQQVEVEKHSPDDESTSSLQDMFAGTDEEQESDNEVNRANKDSSGSHQLASLQSVNPIEDEKTSSLDLFEDDVVHLKLEVESLQEKLSSCMQENEKLKSELFKTKEMLTKSPSALVEELKETLLLAKSFIGSDDGSLPSTPGSLASSVSSGRRPASNTRPAIRKVPLYKGCHLRLDETHFELACSYGVADKLEKGKRNMINKILESIYSPEYMASHSTSGKPAPGAPKEHAKPALPEEDVTAIKNFVKTKWKEWHKLDVEDSSICNAIQSKLQTEHRKLREQQKKIAAAASSTALRPPAVHKDNKSSA